MRLKTVLNNLESRAICDLNARVDQDDTNTMIHFQGHEGRFQGHKEMF